MRGQQTQRLEGLRIHRESFLQIGNTFFAAIVHQQQHAHGLQGCHIAGLHVQRKLQRTLASADLGLANQRRSVAAIDLQCGVVGFLGILHIVFFHEQVAPQYLGLQVLGIDACRFAEQAVGVVETVE